MLRCMCAGALLVLGGVSAALADDASDVRACYNGYKKAILTKDGPAAVEKVDTRTLAYYARMRDLALKSPAAEVRKLPLMDKLMVLSLRHRVPAEKIAAWDEKATFVHAVNEGWIGEDSVKTNELGDVAVSGERATGVHIAKGVKTPLKFSFYKEEGAWKLNLTEFMPVVEKAFKQLATSNGQTDDEFLTTILQIVSGTAVGDKVWEPLQP